MAGRARTTRRAQAIVRQVRSTVVPAAFGVAARRPGATSPATRPARSTSRRSTLDAIPLVFAFVLGLSFLLLLVAFHSIVIPIKAILLNLLSTAAAFGVMVAVFQDGILGGALGLTPIGRDRELGAGLHLHDPVRALDGLPRLHPDPDQGGARPRASTRGRRWPRASRSPPGTITSAASIMVVVFAVFVTLPFAFIQQLGLGLAVAVLIDATIVRSVLLPASMTLLGDWNWWLPRFLRWLPRVTIEGEPETELIPEPVAATSA